MNNIDDQIKKIQNETYTFIFEQIENQRCLLKKGISKTLGSTKELDEFRKLTQLAHNSIKDPLSEALVNYIDKQSEDMVEKIIPKKRTELIRLLTEFASKNE